jgi:hypothetical protein
MEESRNFSRRDFIRSVTAVSAVSLGAPALAASPPVSTMDTGGAASHPASRGVSPLPAFRGAGYRPSDGVAGLLFSQVGYEIGLPVRVIVRLPGRELLEGNAVCVIVPSSNEHEHSVECVYWGSIWGSHWWIAEFPAIDEPGTWSVEIRSGGKVVFQDEGLHVGRNILWDKTLELAAVDMLERRVHFTKVGAGWQDAGTLWVESCSQSAMIIALEDLLEEAPDLLGKSIVERIHRQMVVGCKYLVMTEQKARDLGFPPGAMSHDLLGHEKDILPNDALKAVIALIRASILLPDDYRSEKESYAATARRVWQWLTHTAKPMGKYGLSLFQRGLPEGTAIPADEWQTRDLVLMCWGALAMDRANVDGSKDECVTFARDIMDRQITKEQNENGYYGHFREFTGMAHSEKSWTHGIVDNQFGADIGGIYPNYLLPILRMLGRWPAHEDAPRWRQTLENFTRGYLVPACMKNPFMIVPQGIFGDEGPVWFCGTFHGTDTIYGFTAALALELAGLLKDPVLESIAYGNLQWLMGLNGGITKETLNAAVIFSTDIPEGSALPASLMCGVGNRWAGTWFQTRGVICNGFSTGKQFVYDTEPKKKNDGPFSLTDEDWIPHSAAWLSGLVRFTNMRRHPR